MAQIYKKNSPEIRFATSLLEPNFIYLMHQQKCMTKTSLQFDEVISKCRDLFKKKFKDYGASFRVLRTSSLTDQIFIKVKSLRNFQTSGVSKVGESQEENFIAIVNYAIIGLIQLEKGFSDTFDANGEEILSLYDQFSKEAKNLMEMKNHDYGEAWREMRISSITDLIFQKVLRTKQIEDNQGNTEVSEGIDANYFDMLNYAVFSLIKLSEDSKNFEPKLA